MESFNQLLFLKVSAPLPHGCAYHSAGETGRNYGGLEGETEPHGSIVYRTASQSPGTVDLRGEGAFPT